MNKITIDLDPLIEFLPKNHHMIEKIKECEVDDKHEDISYKDFLELFNNRLVYKNKLMIKELTICRTNSVGKLASQRGARMQLMMKFISELEDEHWFVNAPDEFSTWFDQDGVPL